MASLPHRSSRLARKALSYTPTVTMAQNVSMKKLGLSWDGQLQTTDFDNYICLFDEGLSERQSQLILELVKCNDIIVVEPLEAE
jgi:hypothetical protein